MDLIILNDGIYHLIPVTKKLLDGMVLISDIDCFDLYIYYYSINGKVLQTANPASTRFKYSSSDRLFSYVVLLHVISHCRLRRVQFLECKQSMECMENPHGCNANRNSSSYRSERKAAKALYL